MTLRIHYTINDVEDYYDLSGESIDEIREQNAQEMAKRNLDAEKNNCWSEPL